MPLRQVLRKIRHLISPVDPLAVMIERGARIGRNFHQMSNVIIDPYHAWLI